MRKEEGGGEEEGEKEEESVVAAAAEAPMAEAVIEAGVDEDSLALFSRRAHRPLEERCALAAAAASSSNISASNRSSCCSWSVLSLSLSLSLLSLASTSASTSSASSLTLLAPAASLPARPGTRRAFPPPETPSSCFFFSFSLETSRLRCRTRGSRACTLLASVRTSSEYARRAAMTSLRFSSSIRRRSHLLEACPRSHVHADRKPRLEEKEPHAS